MDLKCVFDFDKRFVEIVEVELKRAIPNYDGEFVTVNFYDPEYSCTAGGWHPVEVGLENGKLLYVTDFSYIGMELEKELDWDFACGVYRQRYMREVPVIAGKGMFELFQSNFISYYNMEVYKVKVSEV